jgi:uncharacterized membrane protein YozB (DUF420 family)
MSDLKDKKYREKMIVVFWSYVGMIGIIIYLILFN